jgi:hypothetical protein
LNSWAAIHPTVERSLKLLRCTEVLKVLRVRAISGLLLEEIINSPGHQLQMLQPTQHLEDFRAAQKLERLDAGVVLRDQDLTGPMPRDARWPRRGVPNNPEVSRIALGRPPIPVNPGAGRPTILTDRQQN